MVPQQKQNEEIQQLKKELMPALMVELRREVLFVGPLPPPEILKEYNECVPSGAERVMAMAEKQASHRQGLETQALKQEHARAMCGLIFAGTISLVVIAGALFLALRGQSRVAAAMVGINFAALTGVFVYGSQIRKKERIEKTALMSGSSVRYQQNKN